MLLQMLHYHKNYNTNRPALALQETGRNDLEKKLVCLSQFFAMIKINFVSFLQITLFCFIN